MGPPADRFRENLRCAAEIKLVPEIWFSAELAAYVHHLAAFEQNHVDAMAICLINVVAIMSRNSKILRRANSYIPLNLYSLIVGNRVSSHFLCLTFVYG
jgi:hypothetical protein